MFVWLFPYLPLAERLNVGPWILVPRSVLAEDDVGSVEAVSQALGLAALYRMPANHDGYGVFVRSTDRRVGEDVDETALGLLSQAITVALLDRNPSPVHPPQADWGAAHATATVENARLIGHGIDDDGYCLALTSALRDATTASRSRMCRTTIDPNVRRLL